MRFNAIGSDGAVYVMDIQQCEQTASQLLGAITHPIPKKIGVIGDASFFVTENGSTGIVKRIKEFPLMTRYSMDTDDDGINFMYPTWESGVNMKLMWTPPYYATMHIFMKYKAGSLSCSISMYLEIGGALYGFPCQNVFQSPAGTLCQGEDSRLYSDSSAFTDLSAMANVDKYIYSTPWNMDAGIRDRHMYREIFRFDADGNQMEQISKSKMVEACTKVEKEHRPPEIIMSQMGAYA